MKEKGSVKKALLKVLALMAEDEMEVNIYSWPPICAGILHQPERPNNVSVKPDTCLYFKRRFNCDACCSNQPANSLTTA